MTGKASLLADIEKPGVKSAQESADEKQEKDLASTENISGTAPTPPEVSRTTWNVARRWPVGNVAQND